MRVEVGPERRTLDPNPWPTPGAFLVAVQRASTGGPIDPALKPLAAAGSDEQGTYSDPAGGYLVPAAHAPMTLSAASEGDPFAGRMLPVPMPVPELHVSARVDKNHTTSVSGGLRVYRTPETVDIDPSRMKMEQIDLIAKDALGLTFASSRLVADSAPAFATMLDAAFRDEYDGLFLEERLWGDGVNEFSGILHSPALITIAKETNQQADTIAAENIVKMRARIWGYRRAIWLANHDAIPQLMKLVIAVGTSGVQIPVWRPGNDEDGVPDMLLGRPLFYIEHAAKVGDLGDIIVVNPSQVLDATLKPIAGASSIHVRFLAVEHAFRFWHRGDSAPWWRSVLTPKRSTTTLSPYVTLADRA